MAKMSLFQMIIPFLLLPLSPLTLLAKETCSRDVVCLLDKKGKGYVDIFIRNKKAYPVTVTVTFELGNMALSTFRPLTETYPGNSTTHAFRLNTVNRREQPSCRYQFQWTRGRMRVEHDDEYIYQLPYEKGKSFPVIQGFNGEFSHQGMDKYAIDFKMPVGTRVYAARAGTVIGVRRNSQKGGPTRMFENDDNHVYILHFDGTIGEYLHLKYNGVAVKVGDKVRAGALLGLSGNTGFSSVPHLHFGVYSSVNGKKRNSHKIKFSTRRGILINPKAGESYFSR